MTSDLAELRTALEATRNALIAAQLPEGSPATALRERLRGRLERDLLPRLSGDTPALLVAIAGPNNVGKSSLFNTLAGVALSPAKAEGGLTKQCLAVASPELGTGPVRALLSQRYEVVQLAPGTPAPVAQPGPPGRLYLALEARMPPGLLLMDTPDFDSVYAQNRTNAEAMLVTVDAVVFVVSRQTYQNAALVAFLREGLQAGRPFVLVYNEASSASQARTHLAKLQADVGKEPFARYAALHQPEVEHGAPLHTEPLDKSPPLLELLAAGERRAELKAQAMTAGRRDLLGELATLANEVTSAAREPDRLLQRLRHELQVAGQNAAQKSVPADVLISAVRDELDARSTFHRWVRLPFRALAAVMTAVGRRARRALAGTSSGSSTDPEALAEASLRDGIRRALEAVAAEAAAYQGDAEIAALLAETLRPEQYVLLEKPVALTPPQQPERDREALAAYCRQLVREELPGGAEEGALQALATLVYSVPASTAAAVTVATGGAGPDAVIWAGTLLTTPLMERFVDLLGAHIRDQVQRRWCDEHGASLARVAEATFFAPLTAALEHRVTDARITVETLRAAGEAVRAAGKEL